jgi:hypothetical protein
MAMLVRRRHLGASFPTRSTTVLCASLCVVAWTACGDSGTTTRSDGGGPADGAADANRDGGTITPGDGGTVTPDGGTITPDGGTVAPDGGTVTPDGGGFTGNPASICSPVPINGDRTSDPRPAPPAAAGVSFHSDWPGIPNGGGYRYTQMMDDCRMQLDGQTTWHGHAALRVEVRPGDDALESGGERAEALIMQDSSGASINESAASGTQYYATSYYFPTTWDATFIHGDSESWSFVMQMYGSGGLSAARHDVGAPQIYQLSVGNNTHDFSNGAIALGTWTDLVLMYTFAATANGHVTVWRRDEGEAKFTQVLDRANVVTLEGSSQYWKQGLYRGPSVNGRTDVLWIGPTARGPSFAAVENAAFGTNDGF